MCAGNEGVPLPSRAISHARGHLRVSRFARRTTEKRETARSLVLVRSIYFFHYAGARLTTCSRTRDLSKGTDVPKS